MGSGVHARYGGQMKQYNIASIFLCCDRFGVHTRSNKKSNRQHRDHRFLYIGVHIQAKAETRKVTVLPSPSE